MIIAEAIDAAWISAGAVVVAALVGGPIMFLMARFDRRNSEQHAENKAVQEKAIDEIKEVKAMVAIAADRAASADQHSLEASRAITAHLAWHLKPDNPQETP